MYQRRPDPLTRRNLIAIAVVGIVVVAILAGVGWELFLSFNAPPTPLVDQPVPTATPTIVLPATFESIPLASVSALSFVKATTARATQIDDYKANYDSFFHCSGDPYQQSVNTVDHPSEDKATLPKGSTVLIAAFVNEARRVYVRIGDIVAYGCSSDFIKE